MLPHDLTLITGQEHLRVMGSGMKEKHFAAPAELREWAGTDPTVSRVHMVLYFAHDCSGKQASRAVGGAFVHDDGTYVAVKAMGDGKQAVDAVLEAVAARARALEGDSAYRAAAERNNRAGRA